MSSIDRSAETIAMTEVNGSTDVKRIGGGIGDGGADAAWIDTFRQQHSYPFVKAADPGSPNNTNNRFQSQIGRHSAQVNIAYADGHAKNSRPRRPLRGNFYGVFANNKAPFSAAYTGKYSGPANGAPWDTPVANDALDQASIAP